MLEYLVTDPLSYLLRTKEDLDGLFLNEDQIEL